MHIIILSFSPDKCQHFHLADEDMESLKSQYFLFILIKKIKSVLNLEKSYKRSAKHSSS